VVVVRVVLHERPAFPWLIAGVVLVGLLATLATFQYRWLGEVSDAERERMRASLRTRASEFTQAFDAELTRVYVAFQMVDREQLDADAASAVGAAYRQWHATATVPALVRGIYLAEGRTFESATVRRFDPDRAALDPAQWPSEFDEMLKRVPRPLPLPLPVGLPPPMLLADAIDASVPALIIPAPRVMRSAIGDRATFIAHQAADARALVVWLDRDSLRRQVLEPLVARYFGEGAASEYVITIAHRDNPSTIVYSSGNGPVDRAAADVTTGLFDLRMDEVSRLSGGRDLFHGPMTTRDRVSITIVRRANAPDGKRVLMTGGDEHGAWEVRARHRGGSLETMVTRSRRRNMAISLGVLGLLGASFTLVMAAAQRQQRLARQQMAFVAAVSHELRTPLAVICSAGENLADGVVEDGAQVKRYGSLIETEGRRLGDMVERVLQFAGISSGSQTRTSVEVDVAKVIADAIEGVAVDARDRGVSVTVRPHRALPPIAGDPDALRSAVQNIVGNAVKYSASGSAVEITAELLDGRIVRMRVADRGIGIDARDLPHIFKPFYRGRRAVDAQVRGTGIGLSVVQHVIRVHGGDVHVDSGAGEGTTVTVVLPAALASDVSDGRGPAVRLRRGAAGAEV
jgi:signal transduction histidine kinase